MGKLRFEESSIFLRVPVPTNVCSLGAQVKAFGWAGGHSPFLNSISRTSGLLGALAGSWVLVYRPGGAWFWGTRGLEEGGSGAEQRAKSCHALSGHPRPFPEQHPRLRALGTSWSSGVGPPHPPPLSTSAACQGPGKQRLGKSDNFSPQLDLISSFDAPTAGGRIAGEEQVRQEK